MSNEHSTPLAQLAKENEVVLIADNNHTDESTINSITLQLAEMYAQGLRHLYLEQDPKVTSLDDILELPSTDAYGNLAREAVHLGVQVHFFDDRSRQRELDARYPTEAALIKIRDPYLKHTDKLVQDLREINQGSAHPLKMEEYLRELMTHKDADLIAFRNERMIDNLSHMMDAHPNEKSLVIGGAAHSEHSDDLDEGLRKKGHQVTTVEIFSPRTRIPKHGMDNPEFAIYMEDVNEQGEFVFYKNPETNKMQRVAGSETLPLKNSEPLAIAQQDKHDYKDLFFEKFKVLLDNHPGIADFLTSTDRDYMKNYVSEKLQVKHQEQTDANNNDINR